MMAAKRKGGGSSLRLSLFPDFKNRFVLTIEELVKTHQLPLMRTFSENLGRVYRRSQLVDAKKSKRRVKERLI